MHKSQFDISSDNFDFFFESQLAKITDAQKELLPKDLLYKILLRGGSVNENSTRKLSFIAKIFILFKALNKRCFIIIEDAENGMSEEDFLKLKKKTTKHDFGEKNVSTLLSNVTFVLGNKEVCDTYHRLNLLSDSSAYNYLVAAKNKNHTKPGDWLESMNYLSRFLSHYEANRKIITMKTGLTMADWLVLIHLYHGNLVKSSAIYQETYQYSYNSSAAKIKASFSLLQARRYVEKIGSTKAAKIRITALGRDKVNEIMMKYVVNC